MSIYSEPSPNTEHIRAVAENIAARITEQCGMAVSAEVSEFCSDITLPCRDRLFISISEVDAGSLPLTADIFFGDGFKQLYSVDFKSGEEFAAAAADFVCGFFGRQVRVAKESRIFGGIRITAEYYEDGQWLPLFTENYASFIMRLFTWRSRTAVSEYDFRTE